MRPSRPILCLAALVSLANAAVAEDGPAPVDFNRDIRPILSNRCYKCHGPDDHERKADLRLDTREGTLKELTSGARAVVPGNVEGSELLFRVASDDPAERMPPTGEKLTAKEQSLLRDWVAGGAKYAVHWSYATPVRPEAPAIQDQAWANWPRNDADRFLLERMLREGLHPSPEADKETILRRVSLDLTGLPPTLEEIDRFLADDSPRAYEAAVDRLLESPSYGEHWARMWLDLARYADSAGYADDPPRTIWAYRDWVIRALNQGMTFDQFTIEQIAGDLLPNPTRDQLIATAFHRNTLTNNEGGTSDEEFRNVAVVDRVNTTMAVWMGTTMACAQCHTHKYDPISQEEYFKFFAILNNTQDADRTDESPRLEIWTPELEAKKAALSEEKTSLEAQIAAPSPALAEAQKIWEARVSADLAWGTLRPSSVSLETGAETTVEADGSVLVPKEQRVDVTTVEGIAEGKVSAIRIETLPTPTLPGGGAGHGGGNFVITGVKATAKIPGAEPKEVKLRAAYADFSQDGFAASNVLDEDMPTPSGWAVSPNQAEPHVLTILPAEAMDLPEGSTLEVRIEQKSPHTGHNLGHFRVSTTADASADEQAGIPASVLAAAKTPAASRTEAQSAELSTHFRRVAPELKPARDRLAAVTKDLAELKPETTVPIQRELAEGQRRETRLQRRGNFMDLGDPVTPGVPAAFNPLPDGAKPDRLSLARWLVDAKNPLTGRVLANRYWEAIFGRGLVPTSEEFGSQGEPPSHPELLDWLATELVASGWDTKAFLRTLVTSATYRQSSRVTPELESKDPGNVFLARGPRFRLSAETIRDQALAVSGLLSPKLFGPPVKPPQPQMGLSAAFGSGIDWQTSAGPDRYRRGIYTTWRRSNPYPSMATFDAPNREVCTLNRTRTNTPLQALVTLNDPVYIEAAQALARRMVAAGSTAEERATLGFRLSLARRPSPEELAEVVRLHERALEHFKGNAEAAQKMATDPLGPAPEGADLPELAAWTAVGNVLLNLDETLMKR